MYDSIYRVNSGMTAVVAAPAACPLPGAAPGARLALPGLFLTSSRQGSSPAAQEDAGAHRASNSPSSAKLVVGSPADPESRATPPAQCDP